MEEAFARWAFQQGGFVAALAVLLYIWRRDMKERVDALKADRDERIQALKEDMSENATRERMLIDVIAGNTRALAESAEAKNRLARAVEHMNQRFRREDLDDLDPIPRRRSPDQP